jgi:hypothetical protein
VSRPDASRGAKLRDLLEEIVVDVPEERQARRKRINVETARYSALDVGKAIRERECELLRRRRSGLSDMVAGDLDRVQLRHMLSRPLESVDD